MINKISSRFKIENFMLGRITDDMGRYISEIHKFSNEQLKYDHQFIQWLFPIETVSVFNPKAPIIGNADIQFFRSNREVKKAQLRSLDLMLDFWNLKRENEKIYSKFNESFYNHFWTKKNNHNQLRITRTIRSLFLFGNKKEAEQLKIAVLSICGKIPDFSIQTIDYWKKTTK